MLKEDVKLFIIRQSIIMIILIVSQMISGLNGWWGSAIILCVAGLMNIAYTHEKLNNVREDNDDD